MRVKVGEVLAILLPGKVILIVAIRVDLGRSPRRRPQLLVGNDADRVCAPHRRRQAQQEKRNSSEESGATAHPWSQAGGEGEKGT